MVFSARIMTEISTDMEEISGSKPGEDAALSDFDPEKMRTTKPGLKRLFLTLSILISFVIGKLRYDTIIGDGLLTFMC